MALINIFAHPYAMVCRSFFPFNSLIPFPILILTLIHSRCAACTVEMSTLINGSTLKLATTLELSTVLVVAAASVDAPSSRIEQMREAWEIHMKSYTAKFFEIDPCTLDSCFGVNHTQPYPHCHTGLCHKGYAQGRFLFRNMAWQGQYDISPAGLAKQA
ncbi:hypothetical protein JHK85_006852 [Glycine max]|nr:hypothetical protein JHK85_006852 [Glycine max]KAG5071446.1 hypothetical protein JHK86_006657 [Glycine max]